MIKIILAINFIICCLIVIIGLSCTKNQKVKQFGGKATIHLPENRKLMIVTWKDNNLWYLTRPMLKSDTALEYQFHEESSWGVWEGTYTIKEIRK